MKGKTRIPRPVSNIKWLRDAALDFSLGSAMLEKHFGDPRFPLRAMVVTKVFAIELFLKFLAAKETNAVPEGHDLFDLYTNLSENSRNAILQSYRGRRPLIDVLNENRHAFIEWRYVYEKQGASFSLDLNGLGDVVTALDAVARTS